MSEQTVLLHLPFGTRTRVLVRDGVKAGSAIRSNLQKRGIVPESCIVCIDKDPKSKQVDLNSDLTDLAATLDKKELWVHSEFVNLSMTIKHNFARKTFFTVSYCDHCHKLILLNGFRCTLCNFRFHQKCSYNVPEYCDLIKQIKENPRCYSNFMKHCESYGNDPTAKLASNILESLNTPIQTNAPIPIEDYGLHRQTALRTHQNRLHPGMLKDQSFGRSLHNAPNTREISSSTPNINIIEDPYVSHQKPKCFNETQMTNSASYSGFAYSSCMSMTKDSNSPNLKRHNALMKKVPHKLNTRLLNPSLTNNYDVSLGSSNSTHMSSSMASMPSPSSTCSSPCPTKELPKFLLGHHLTSEPLSAPPTKPLGGFFYDKTPEFGDNSYEMSHGNKKSSSASTSESIISHSTDSKNELCRYAWEIQRSLVEFGPKIGSGSFGTVYRGHYCGDVAIKRINTNGEPSEKQLIDFQSEVSILKDMRHGNVLLFMGIVKTPELCIITQWCEGSSLYKHLHVTEPKWELEITKVIDISKQVSNGMGYLHSRKIIHRDLKSNNIFLTADETVKIGDFGLATVKQKFTSESTAKLRPTGSILWMAPEIIRMKVEEPYSFWSDIYAFGIVLYELLTNNLPYAGIDNRDAIFFRVGMGLLKPDLSQLRKNCPKSLRSLLENCIKFKREERPLFPAILGTMENIRQELPKMQKSHSAPLLNRPDDEMIQERNSGKQQHPSTPMYGTRHPYFVASSSRGVDD